MATGLTDFARRLAQDEDGLRREVTVPVLVLEHPRSSEGELLFDTSAGTPKERPRSGEPQVYLLRKSSRKQNAFGIGVTLGRTDNNDLVIDDHSVSRFHAYFQQDTKTSHWKVVDAESKNGTWLSGQKLPHNKPVLVLDESRLKFGDIELLFLHPESFFRYLERLME